MSNGVTGPNGVPTILDSRGLGWGCLTELLDQMGCLQYWIVEVWACLQYWILEVWAGDV